MKASSSAVAQSATFLDELIAALERASAYNRNDQAAPAVVLWPDKERQWEALLPRLRARLPILTLGAYAPAQGVGPAYWLRAVIARTLPDERLPEGATPILYLPGVSKQEIRAVEESPRLLQPLAELQYRGALWTQKNGRDWTLTAFVQSADGGLGLAVAGDAATRDALQRALPKLADEPLARLRTEAPLRAAFFDELLTPDEARSLLQWLNDPQGYRMNHATDEWAAFCSLCQRKYGFSPDHDGPITAARSLGERQAAWESVWRRFAEAPSAYLHIPDLLRQARPQQPLAMFDAAESWPQENEAAEATLRERLSALRGAVASVARAEIIVLEGAHAHRRAWVWSRLNQTPLAAALEHLATLAHTTEQTITGATIDDVVADFTSWGWRADAAALGALAEVARSEDVAVVKGAILTLYRPWLEAGAQVTQRIALGSEANQRAPLPTFEHGDCILFCDALRFDVGKRLAGSLEANGYRCAVTPHLAATPTVTPTAKPAISPVRDQLTGGLGFDAAVRETGARVTVDVLRRLLSESGYQLLKDDDTGNPDGRAWTECGEIDSYGHQYGWKLTHHVADELRSLEERIATLLAAGWQRIVVVTDHGWLLLPEGLPKVELPEHLTTVRKGRCARLKASSSVDLLTLPWYWDANVRVAYGPGIACFEAGKEYEHGGVSPQEWIVPTIIVTGNPVAAALVSIEQVTWRGLRCAVRVTGASTDLRVDLRARPGDPISSVVGAPKALSADGAATVLVEDDDLAGESATVVIVDSTGVVRAQADTTIGG